MKKIIIPLFLLLTINLFADDNIFYILFSNNCNGNLVSCNCPSHPYGGLAKRKTFIDQFREKNKNVIVVDSGDAYSTIGDTILDKYVSQAVQIINYDAAMVGFQELQNGDNFFLQNKNNINYTCANIFNKKTKTELLTPFITIKKIIILLTYWVLCPK